MTKEQQKMMRYAHVIDDLIANTQKIQAELNPLFEELKKNIKDNKANLANDTYEKTLNAFKQGTADYQLQLDKLANAVVPARFLGAHHSLVAAYRDYVAGCQKMVDSMHDDATIDEQQFFAAETQQNNANLKITRYLQKLI